MTAGFHLEAAFPEPWETYAVYPFHLGGRPGVIRSEFAFWDYLIDEARTVAGELADYSLESFRGDAAQSLHGLITQRYVSGVTVLATHAGRMREQMGDYDGALADLRELMELNKEQARLHRDGWETKAREYESLGARLLSAAGAGDMTLYYRIAEELLVVQEEYLHHIREFSLGYDNAIDLRTQVVDVDCLTAEQMRTLTDQIELCAPPGFDAGRTGAALEVVEEDLVEAGRRLIDEGLYLQWLPAAVLPVPAEGVDAIAGERVVAASAEVVDALTRAVDLLSERIQVTGSAMIGAAVHYAATDEEAAAALITIVMDRTTPESAEDSRTAAGYSQSMIEALDGALGGGTTAGSRLGEMTDRAASRMTGTAEIVTVSAAIAESVDAGVPVGEAVRQQVEPAARDALRDAVFAKINRRLGKRVAGTAAMSLLKPRLVGRLGSVGVATQVVLAGYDGITAAREVRETKRRMEIRARQAEQG